MKQGETRCGTPVDADTIRHENSRSNFQYLVVGAVILAAGYSSRMDGFKPLLPLGGKSALERVIGAFQAAGACPIAVVTGHRRDELLPLIAQSGAVEAFNPDYEKGMFSSIKAGIQKILAAAPEGCDGFLLMPVDCAAVTGDTIRFFLSQIDRNAPALAAPCYWGKKGHPLWIPARYAAEILSYEGGGGLKGALKPYEACLVRVETGSESVVLDMDDREGYEAVLAYHNRNGAEEDVRALAGGRRFFFIRHGEIRQHADKIFLGQQDVPLSETGRKQAAEAAAALRAFAPRAEKIYSSDLCRASETAAIIAEALRIPAVETLPAFREIALGAWDGRLVDEIKREHPAAYEQRGRALLAYKIDAKSENFYDLRYRVQKGLTKLLKQDAGEDVIIAAHAGAIRAALACLRGQAMSIASFEEAIALGSVTAYECR